MSKSRVVLVASPVAGNERDIERDRAAQVVDTIRAELNAQWIGWSSVPVNRTEDVLSSGQTNRGAVSTLGLSAAEVTAIRDQVSERILWPVFHGRPDLMQFDADAYEAFLNANRRLAHALLPILHDNDQVWVHDYLHVPLAHTLRDEGFEGPIGLLLHTPFPSPDHMATLPGHEELISELCCYNLLGFQTETCLANFHVSAERSIDAGRHNNGSHDSLRGPFGKVKTYVAEIPGNTKAIARNAKSSAVRRSDRYLQKCSEGRDLIGSFATLDSGQGILERLKSYEVLLEQTPKMCGRISMVQVTLPRQHWLEDDDDVGAAVEQEFMRINGRFATLDWTPIRYFHKLLPSNRLTALYRSVRVGLIAPLSTGGNLAAKDFIAAQNPADPGVLVASSLVGGGKLPGALYVNPYDTADLSMALNRALRIPLTERQARWSSMMDVLEAHPMEAWCGEFVARLARSKSVRSTISAA